MSRPSVVILGGGFAGLEAAFLLRHRLRDAVDVTLVSDRDSFLFRPHTIYIPFGADPSRFEIPLEGPAARRGIRLLKARVLGVDPGARRVRVEGGSVPYDFLIIATGAAMRPEEIPGLREHAGTLWIPQDMLRLRSTFERIVRLGQDGVTTEVLFLVPPNNKCAGPLYEMVLMLETHLRRSRARGAIRLLWATAERGYVQAFGPKLDEVVAEEFRTRGIEGHRSRVVTEVEPGAVRFLDGTVMRYDELIAFPPYVASVRYDGLPSDARGFLRTAPDNRGVSGVDGVFAPGDAGDFPVKQAFLAFLQADAAAEAIAGAVLRQGPRTVFDPVSMCVMEELDTATFAQVPLELTGRPDRPIAVRAGRERDYRVGVSPLWRLGKKALGLYLPWRFRTGKPFHAGAAWSVMDAGLKAMSTVMAQ
jgi:NADH dehydrogenase FAD-containing subunit